MPVVARDLSGLALFGWAFSAFLLGNLVGIVYAGIQIDRIGLSRPFALGLGLFAIGLVIVGLAPIMPVVVAGRAVQGFGAAAVPTVAYVAIGRSYAESARPRMFATLSTAWVIPGLVGPAIAGLVADHLGWRLVFLGLVPFVVVGALLVLPSLRPLTPAPGVGDPSTSRRLGDAIRIAAGASLVLAVPVLGVSVLALLAVVGGLGLGIPALRRLLPPGTLTARRGLPATVLARGMATFSFFGAEAYLPLALVLVRGTSVTEAGLALTAATLSWTAGSWVQARQMARWGGPRLILLGFVCVTAGIAGMATVVLPATPLVVTVVAWAIGGLGMGLAYAPIAMLVLRDAPPGGQGAATSAMQVSDVLGAALGTGLGGAFVAVAGASGADYAIPIAIAFGVAAAVAAGGIAVSRRLEPPRS
jgi:MFS family permease